MCDEEDEDLMKIYKYINDKINIDSEISETQPENRTGKKIIL